MTQRLDQEIFGGANPATGEPAGQPPRPRIFSNLFALILSLAVVLGGAYGVYRVAAPAISDFVASDDYPGPGSGNVDVVIKEGDTGRAIASTLVRAGVIKTSSAFVSASSEDADTAKKIQPGTYTLQKEMKASDALVMLADPKNRSVNRVTIPEGLWATEIYERLSKGTGVPLKDYAAAAKDAKKLGLPSQAKGKVEGWLFPETYEFGPKDTAAQQLKVLVDQAKKVMTDEKIPAKEWQETMIMASIIESEAGSSSDRRKVSRVFWNRLEQPTAETVGLLQSDATVSYGAKRRAVAPTKAEIDDESNPYNTRIHKGLPPGPISNPGKDSIDAAVNPAKGDWLYFVTVNPDTGETKFSETHVQFLEDSKEFQQWCEENPKAKC